MVPGRTERVVGDGPALRENDEIDVGRAGFRRRGQHGEDRRIGVVERYRADRREPAELIFVGIVIAVPGDDVERRVPDLRAMQLPSPLHDERARGLAILVGGHGREKVALVGETICPDRASPRQPEGRTIILTDIAARRPLDQLHAEDDAARDDANLPGSDLDHAELGAEAQLPLLRHDQHLPVRIHEMLVRHGGGDKQHMRRHAGHGLGVTRRGDGAEPAHECQLLVGNGDRPPPALAERLRAVLALGRGTKLAAINAREATDVPHGWPDAI